MTDQPTVALLGTGTMGAAMARNIAGAGIPLRVWNRTRERAETLSDVATVHDSVAAAVAGADVVLTMLFDADSVADTMEEARAALGDDVVWLQQSTVGVAGTARLAKLAEELGVVLVDAPVLGTRKPAEDGALVVLGSGPETARDRVAPVLDAIGSRTMWVGEAGAGTRLKLAANAWVFTVVEGVAESLALTRELGLDPRLFLEAVGGGALDAPYVQLKGAAMLDGTLDPAFALEGALKDAGLILDAAQSVGLELGVLPGVRDHFARAVRAGHGDRDMAATWLEH
ncbi:NAD(P)-dependent oxidoreductase [Nocardioides sp. MAHUQ-72]|uniref:NAD(P)-dependent oxidoreductase n=1 Tax=unclassified Nocardioides TaxID=2615069 RepID=UPI003617F786